MGKLTLDPNAQFFEDLAALDPDASSKLGSIDEGAKNMASIPDWAATQAYAENDVV